MKGWTTYSFADRTFYHHRKMGTAGSNELISRFNYGKKDYFLGGHPLWEIARSLYQMTKRPYIIGGSLLLFGYLWAFLSRVERPVSKELMKFHRSEQMSRLKNMLGTTVGLKG